VVAGGFGNGRLTPEVEVATERDELRVNVPGVPAKLGTDEATSAGTGCRVEGYSQDSSSSDLSCFGFFLCLALSTLYLSFSLVINFSTLPDIESILEANAVTVASKDVDASDFTKLAAKCQVITDAT